MNQGAPKGRQQKGETGPGTHILADFCRFSLIFGSLCKSRDWGVADLRRKPQETADFRTLTLQSLFFSISLLFSFSDFPCFFVGFFLCFPRILGVPRFFFFFFGENPLLFPKKQGLEGQGRKQQIFAGNRRKPQIFAETGFSHLLSPFWRALKYEGFISASFWGLGGPPKIARQNSWSHFPCRKSSATQKSRRTKVPRIFRIFVPDFAPNFSPNFSRIF